MLAISLELFREWVDSFHPSLYLRLHRAITARSYIVKLGDDMKTNIYVNNDKFIAGMTMKDRSELEHNNMALHTCENPDYIVENRKKLAVSLHCKLMISSVPIKPIAPISIE